MYLRITCLCIISLYVFLCPCEDACFCMHLYVGCLWLCVHALCVNFWALVHCHGYPPSVDIIGGLDLETGLWSWQFFSFYCSTALKHMAWNKHFGDIHSNGPVVAASTDQIFSLHPPGLKKKKKLDTSKHFCYTVSAFTQIKHKDQLLINVCVILRVHIDPNIMRLLNSKHTYLNGGKIYDQCWTEQYLAIILLHKNFQDVLKSKSRTQCTFKVEVKVMSPKPLFYYSFFGKYVHLPCSRVIVLNYTNMLWLHNRSCHVSLKKNCCEHWHAYNTHCDLRMHPYDRQWWVWA